jgi:hypothetical protein
VNRYAGRVVRYLALALLLCAGCTTTRTFDMTWSFTHTGACKGAGVDPSYASQKEITLRYVKAPAYFAVFCSNKLATALTAGKKRTVTMVERRNGGRGSSTSICAVDGLKDDAPDTTCTFAGHVSSGYENAPNPTPWD